MVKQLSVKEAKDKILKDDVQVIDIRNRDVFTQGHISGAVNINNENIDDLLTKFDKTKPTIVYCYHGISSQPAAQYLAAHGFEDIYSLEGGYEAWVSEV